MNVGPRRTLTQRLRGISYRATESLRPSIDALIPEVERLTQERDLYALAFRDVALHNRQHANMGRCPETREDPSRDPGCHVCKTLLRQERRA